MRTDSRDSLGVVEHHDPNRYWFLPSYHLRNHSGNIQGSALTQMRVTLYSAVDEAIRRLAGDVENLTLVRLRALLFPFLRLESHVCGLP